MYHDAGCVIIFGVRRHPRIISFLIILLAIAAGVFVYPRYFGAKWRPWRLGLDLVGGSHLVYAVDLSKVASGDRDSVLGGIQDVITRRVNFFGVSEPQIFVAQAGEDAQLVVQLAGIKDVGEAIKAIGETPLLDFREVVGNGTSTEFIPTNLTGRYVTGAQLTFDPTTGAPQVAISFNADGGTIFEELTGKNVGKPIAIFLDNALIEMPTVQQKISGGQALITGRFTIAEAKKLVERFNAGALPAPITLISQQTVSATLGADSLKKAVVAGIVGTLLVVLFMVFYYGRLGAYAAVALAIYIVFTLAIFKGISVTMTLAGFAGFVITIGMAVDANILIFARMREEERRGLTRGAALEEGFKRAWASIRDSNVSTILTAVILYYFTSSFIRGFALTLLLGVLVSMLTAITVTRTFLRAFYVKLHP